MNLLQRANLFHSINSFHLPLEALKKKIPTQQKNTPNPTTTNENLYEFLFYSMSANLGIHILWQV